MGIPRGKYFAFSNVNNEYDECSRESRDVRRLTWCANYICVCAWCTNFTTLVNCREGCKNLSWHLILFCLPPFVKAHWNLLLFFVQCVSGSSWLRRLAFLWCGILETLAKKWFQCICVMDFSSTVPRSNMVSRGRSSLVAIGFLFATLTVCSAAAVPVVDGQLCF